MSSEKKEENGTPRLPRRTGHEPGGPEGTGEHGAAPATPLSRRQHRPHDFRKVRVASPERLRALDTLHRKFARSVSSALSVLVRARVQVDLCGVDQRPYFEFTRSLQSPTCLHLVTCLPQRTPLVLEIHPSILFAMIERILGGRGENASQPARPLTRIEQALVRPVVDQILVQLREVWSASLAGSEGGISPGDGAGANDLRFDVVEVEHNPLLLQIVGPSEPAMVLSFQIAMGAGLGRAAQLHVCFPAKPFDPLLARLTRAALPGSHGEQSGPQEREAILRKLCGTSVEMTAELASVPLSLTDVFSLRPGDVIDTQKGRSSEVSILIEGREALRGQPLSRDGRRTVRIT